MPLSLVSLRGPLRLQNCADEQQSAFSMTVLPRAATIADYFICLAVFTTFTLAVAFNLQRLVALYKEYIAGSQQAPYLF